MNKYIAPVAGLLGFLGVAQAQEPQETLDYVGNTMTGTETIYQNGAAIGSAPVTVPVSGSLDATVVLGATNSPLGYTVSVIALGSPGIQGFSYSTNELGAYASLIINPSISPNPEIVYSSMTAGPSLSFTIGADGDQFFENGCAGVASGRCADILVSNDDPGVWTRVAPPVQTPEIDASGMVPALMLLSLLGLTTAPRGRRRESGA